MKVVYLHIGLPKTGTSSIQKSLFQNEDLLLRNGVLVPKTGRVTQQSATHHNLSFQLIDDPRFRESKGTWGDLVNEINQSSAETIILSSDILSGMKKSKLKEIRKYIGNHKIKIVIYLRRQDDLLQSIWAQNIKNSYLENFYLDFDKWILDRNNYKNYHFLINNWGSIFGKENITIRIFEKKQLNGILFNDFLKTCNIQNSEIYEPSENQNITPGIKTIFIIKEMKTRLVGILNIEQRYALYHNIQRFGEIHNWNEEKINLIDTDLSNYIMGLYKESNQTIAREFFKRDELFLEPIVDRKLTRFSLEDYKQEELLDLFAFLCGEIFGNSQEWMGWGDLERQYVAKKNELEAIHASRGWKWLQRFRALRRKLQTVRKK